MQTGSIDSELLPFLNDSAETTRLQTLKALGRLESAQAKAAVENVLKKENSNKQHQSFLLQNIGFSREVRGGLFPTPELALGRIKGRKLKGQDKVEALCQSVGLSFSDVAQLSHKVNDPIEGKYAAGSAGYEIVDELVDLLYSMRKQGEDVSWYVNRLTLRAAQQVKLRGADLSPQEEIQLIIDYLAPSDMEKTGDDALADHMMGLDSSAADLVLAKLQQMLQEAQAQKPPQMHAMGYSSLVRAVAGTRDRRLLPLLRQFEKLAEPEARKHYQSRIYWVWAESQRVKRRLTNDEWFPPRFP